jgi:predicted transcriptional regulator
MSSGTGGPSRRTRVELYRDILSCVKEGEGTPTRITYECNLSWSSFRQLMGALTRSGCIEVVGGASSRSVVAITGKGERILGTLNRLTNMIDLSGGVLD